MDLSRDPSWDELIRAAAEVRVHAYAPYSSYLVGAAIRTTSGAIVRGCNVENASYGGTICAERNAVWSAVALGYRQFSACVVMTQGPEPGSPCGMCRQVLAEFAQNLPILLVTPEDQRVLTTLEELLPRAFRPEHLPSAVDISRSPR